MGRFYSITLPETTISAAADLFEITAATTYTVEEYQSQLSLQMLNEYRELADSSEDERKALFLSQRWTRNTLDDLLAPRKGAWARLQVGGAVEGLYPDRTFVRITGKAVWLLPVKSFGTLQLRAEAGVVLASSRADIPSSYLFRTGGDNTIRGYAYESLGVAEGDSVVGGRYLGVASVEYVQWLRAQWGAAVFYDFGNAVDDLSAWRTLDFGCFDCRGRANRLNQIVDVSFEQVGGLSPLPILFDVIK